MYFTAIDHVQLAMPAGEEDSARAFYCDLLGMTELPKPAELAKRGGCWFGSGAVQIHLGVEKDFRPAKKAHPALRCRDYSALLDKLRSAGAEVLADDNNPGVARCYVHDPFGNRIEFFGIARPIDRELCSCHSFLSLFLSLFLSFRSACSRARNLLVPAESRFLADEAGFGMTSGESNSTWEWKRIFMRRRRRTPVGATCMIRSGIGLS